MDVHPEFFTNYDRLIAAMLDGYAVHVDTGRREYIENIRETIIKRLVRKGIYAAVHVTIVQEGPGYRSGPDYEQGVPRYWLEMNNRYAVGSLKKY